MYLYVVLKIIFLQEDGDQDMQQKIKDDLKKVQKARMKLITEIYTNLPAVI